MAPWLFAAASAGFDRLQHIWSETMLYLARSRLRRRRLARNAPYGVPSPSGRG